MSDNFICRGFNGDDALIEPQVAVLERLRHQQLGLLTEYEAALALNLSERNLIAMRKSGRSPQPIWINRAPYYTVASIRKWIANLDHGSPQGALLREQGGE